MKEDVRAKAQDEKTAKKAEEAPKHAYCAITSRKTGPSVDAAITTTFYFGKPFITSPSPRHGGLQTHVLGKMVPLAKFHKPEYDHRYGGQRLKLKDEAPSEITLHYLKSDS